MIDYNNYIDLDRVILQDCVELYEYKGLVTVIEDGRITNFVKEGMNHTNNTFKNN